MKAYWLNEYECWAGNDLEEAIAAALETSKATRDEMVEPTFVHEADPNQRIVSDETGEETTIGEELATMTKPGLVCGAD